MQRNRPCPSVLTPNYETFFDVETSDGTKCFRMRPQLRDAIESISELLEAMKLPVRDIFKRYYEGEDSGLVVE